MKPNYYNENDPAAAAWLRELIRARAIAPGEVDERSITDISYHELKRFHQCHFFAGIGGWSYALRLAGWPDERPVWTGSCPCQPFSTAGKRKVDADERHLWPAFRAAIAECQPAIVFGEQVAGADGRTWLAGVRADLETLGYEVGAADLCAAGVGEKGAPIIVESQEFLRELAACADARGHFEIGIQIRELVDYFDHVIVGPPHIRQRLFWVADSKEKRRGGRPVLQPNDETGNSRAGNRGAVSGLVNATGGRANAAKQPGQLPSVEPSSETGGLVLANGAGRNARQQTAPPVGHGSAAESAGGAGGLGGAASGQAGLSRFAWRQSDAVACADGKARRVESGTFPLAHGVPGRVGLLRGYGNAIVPQLAAEFIQAWQEATTN